jgi:hypothetical protein
MADFVELTLEQGATFNSTITVRDDQGVAQNLTGYSARSQMRRSYYSSSKKDFTVTVTSPAGGQITMYMSAANTANVTPGRYVYDVELEDNGTGDVTRIFEGIVTVLPNVTR